MFSSNSFAEWEKLKKNSVDGDTFYVDFERIRKHDGYVYYWVLEDLIKPDKDGDLSYRNYFQGDCKLFRTKLLSGSYHKGAMGKGTGWTSNPKNPEWEFPTPNSIMEDILKLVCSR